MGNVIGFCGSDCMPCYGVTTVSYHRVSGLTDIVGRVGDRCALSSSVPLRALRPLSNFAPGLFCSVSMCMSDLGPDNCLGSRFATRVRGAVGTTTRASRTFAVLGSPCEKAVFRIGDCYNLSVSSPDRRDMTLGKERGAK